ncbi:tripartite motif-containing protein 16-like [Solea solea]|uniref:tripartite motif-containing protein 16-like n=1 Tax=Solea solea TaxID=90069 RepID=UPI00272AC0A4|nr:tripartite motif-containing protein 16-like [Solea solea]
MQEVRDHSSNWFKLAQVRGEMAQKGVQLERETVCCSICLDLPKDPVSIPCGHSYCMGCIQNHWDTEEEKKVYQCPDCRHTFEPRPLLMKNTMLAVFVEDLKKTGLQAAPPDHCFAGPEDVACDFCTGRKLKAFKSCLLCLASYCEKHLRPHYDSATFKKHKLVDPSMNLQENICSRHDEVMKMFCRTDQQCICYLCSVDQHKGHDTVTATAERMERQKEVEVSLEELEQTLEDREEEEKKLEQEVEAVNRSADRAVEDSETVFTELIRVVEKGSSELMQQIRSQQESEVSRVKDLQEKLQQEITVLKSKHAALKQLLNTQDHNQFLLSYSSLSTLCPSKQAFSIDVCPLRYFEEVTAAVSQVRAQIQDVLTETWRNISPTVTPDDVLLSPSEPKTRAGFLQYSKEIKMDPNTVNGYLMLAEDNRKVTVMSKPLSYTDHPDRFSYRRQVLSRESLTGRCYWEVERTRGEGAVNIAVTYKDIHRAGTSDKCRFGCNKKSWSLDCNDTYTFFHDYLATEVSGPVCSRVGVYLDHSAGTMSFYSVSDTTMTLLHKVQTTFTQPLYAGVYLRYSGCTAEFCKLK